jgi:ABC-type oligopeptide transport system substrate-binding subunit/class 3 adenylate cyclase
MQCPKCNTENREGAKFCASCGASLVLVCAQCGTELLASMRFCDRCGNPVGVPFDLAQGRPPPAAPDHVADRLQRLVPKEFAERLLATRGQVAGERRIVTILFSDVKGSTAMAESLDPEDVMEIMDGAFDVLIEPIYRYEGTLARLMGDAILAFFGAPIAHEDDPERACRAALEIIEGAQKYAARLEEERGIRGFNVRVGINTGLVVVGEVGSDLRVEYTAMGDAINLAARMESAAEPGTILITEDTHKLIAPLFETEALGPIQVKGKTEPVSVYRVLAPKVVPLKPRGIAGLESPLVGREAELGALREAMERLQAGVGGIVTLVGEAGIGKSRLVAEAQKRTLAKVRKPSQGWSSVQWVEGRCLSYGTSIAYLLWLDVLRALLEVSPEDTPVAVRDTLREQAQALCPDRFEGVYPYLGRLMSLPLEAEEEAIVRDVEGEQLKAGTFRAVETLVECAASKRPLVLVCEDLHWADPTSMELLEDLLALTDSVPLLFICVFRPQTEHGCWRLRETVARRYRHRHTDLWLHPLSAAESEILVGNLLYVEGLPPKLKERILSHAEGNPFYVEEIIRSLMDSEAIVRDEATGRWQATRDVADIAIPDTLHGVLMARIDRLQEETKRVLQLAAVIGRIFLYRVLAAIAREERKLDDHLLTLQREEMIRERARLPELEYIFKHHLTQEAAYNGLLKKKRRVYHRQVAEALERLFPERVEEQVGLLAHHWERAEEPEKATAYLLRAGDQARLAYAHQEAIDYFQRALALLKEQQEYERAARTLMKLGLTYHSAFDFKEARQAYEEGFVLWQRAGEMEPAVLPPTAPHGLRVALMSESPTLDPGLASDMPSSTVTEQLFSGLVELSPELSVVPDVARSWQVLDGGRKYVFRLRDDVRWSDGAPMTAGDFEYAWKRVLDPAIGSPNASLLYDIQGARAYHQGDAPDPDQVGVRALDEFTLAVGLEEPTGYFPHLLTCHATYPVPRHVVEAHREAWTEVGNIATNGPFRLAAWERGESMVLERNPAYHGRFTGNLLQVELSSPSQQPARILQMYEDNRLEAFHFGRIPQADWYRARQRYAGEHVSGPSLMTWYIGFHVNRPPFDDRRVRRAFILATDRETLADVARRGYVSPATAGFVPPGMPGHSPGIGLPYDPEGARHLLAEAGYPGGRGFPVLESLASHWPWVVLTVEYLQAQWRENLGVEITWKQMELGRLLDRLSRESPHLWLMGWIADYPDPDNFLRVSTWRFNTGWQSEAYDGLVEGARRALDQGKRMRMYQQADRILVEEAPILPLFYSRLHLLVKPWVKRFPVSPLKWWFWKDVIIEPH